MLRRLKLASQFTLLLSLIFIAGIALGGLALSKALEQKAEMEMSHRGQIAMQMVNAVKSYTSKEIANGEASATWYDSLHKGKQKKSVLKSRKVDNNGENCLNSFF